ncbi:MAG TPA: hypothetical protein V6D47_07935 [Oscillatoriaceae cyanobacterium]
MLGFEVPAHADVAAIPSPPGGHGTSQSQTSDPSVGSGGGSGGGGSGGSAPSGPGFAATVSFSGLFSLQRIAGQPIGGLSLGTTATNTELSQVAGVVKASDGTLFVCDPLENQIRGLPASGTPFVAAGDASGTPGFTGDNLPAVGVRLDAPTGLALDSKTGALFVCDNGNNRVRYFVPDGRIYTEAGGGTDASDTVPNALNAALEQPYGVAIDGEQRIYFTERGNGRVRMVDATGKLSTLATLTPGQVGPIAVSTAGDRLWVGDGSGIRILLPQSTPVLQSLPLASIPGTVVTGLAYDQAGTLYVARTDTSPSGLAGTLIQSVAVGETDAVQTIAGTSGASATADAYSASTTVIPDARTQLLAGAGACSLFIDLANAGSTTVLSGLLYAGNSYQDASGTAWGEVLKLTPTP